MNMSANDNNDEVITMDTDSKPVFPPLPAITANEFEEELSPEDIEFYKEKFKELENCTIKEKLHCTACDRHLGATIQNAPRMRMHPMLLTLVCKTCYTFYNSGEFEKGDDGSELYCRWCGQGGQVYCCAGCPHVFCAKCVKRNFGIGKIKEIENTDDWKCFKCVPGPLKNLKAVCWALLRLVDQRERIIAKTLDGGLKKKYNEIASEDIASCCKDMRRRRTSNVKQKDSIKIETPPAKKIQHVAKKSVTGSAGIQVKKFASINNSENNSEKKAVKRAASPKQNKISILKKPVQIMSPLNMPRIQSYPQMKKVKIAPFVSPTPQDKFTPFSNAISYPRAQLQPQNMPPKIPIPFHTLNNYVTSSTFNDNINLSLESLTQGLDMNNIMTQQNNSYNDDLVCTPDFPLEPLCEVTEDNQDDDVECVTPSNIAAAPIRNNLLQNPPQRKINKVSPENIIQMSESDVTVNTVTGGLKFRIDPKTLSASKMYRLPDGRVFSININPNMPGGYSATIVSLTETENRPIPKKTIPPKINLINNNKNVKVLSSRQTEPKKDKNID